MMLNSVVDKEPKHFAGSGPGTQGYRYGSGSGTGLYPNKKLAI
jgi:hypothetical protein